VDLELKSVHQIGQDLRLVYVPLYLEYDEDLLDVDEWGVAQDA